MLSKFMGFPIALEVIMEPKPLCCPVDGKSFSKYLGCLYMGQVSFYSSQSASRTKLSCRSVHNVRIEQPWVDVTAQVSYTWTGLFKILELRHGLDTDNQNHLWFIHYLFLATINDHLALFAQGWNEH
ncbi:hypothetical protein C8J56DRAFT_931312 [Mycena floridula]|nr:hypothetical protein C8J56DRAFT_986939 [Mycena floridula]KAJ7573125.1 hypothetical protein C8J56DRAFT_984451 [Mycena floridula]KAJ7590370.1 hypothetical protein C8J56DRAFT_937370 [Mycena floridula]KAJ7593540.1 hypothetical protein C8J56DRAFT_931312 [Mycena floridula]